MTEDAEWVLKCREQVLHEGDIELYTALTKACNKQKRKDKKEQLIQTFDDE